MTFTTLVDEIAARLNLTSSTATTRIGRLLNERYREITASLGLDVSRRTKVSANTTIGSSDVTFATTEHIERVVDERTTPYIILDQVSYDEIRALNPESHTSDNPYNWALKSVTAAGATITLDVKAETVFALKADVLGTNSDLSGSNEPAFPQSFHYILKEAVLYDEYMKVGDEKKASMSMARAEKGISDLRMSIAKSGFMEINQNKFDNGSTLRPRKLRWP